MKIVASKEEQYQKWIKNNPLKKFTQRQKDEQVLLKESNPV